MPKAEVGSTKYLNNKLKSKGLQRLRWYCQVCEKQCRDENGFKCHVQSESHVRALQVVGETGANKVINDFSSEFKSTFLKLLRTSHGEKPILINHFYNQFISDKEHVHMNSTHWPSLTEFAKHLGRDGLCRVEDTDKGLQIAWIDNSPEALRRQDALRKKERQDRGDEEREQKLIREQIEKARKDAEAKEIAAEDVNAGELRKEGGEKVKLDFGSKPTEHKDLSSALAGDVNDRDSVIPAGNTKSQSLPTMTPTPPPEKISLKLNNNPKPKNVFAAPVKKNALTGPKLFSKEAPKRPISEAERIMKEEIERKRIKDERGASSLNVKRPRFA